MEEDQKKGLTKIHQIVVRFEPPTDPPTGLV